MQVGIEVRSRQGFHFTRFFCNKGDKIRRFLYGGIAFKTNTAAEQTVAASNAITTDTIQKTDSAALAVQTNIRPDSNYKYVLEIAKSKRAFRRYNQLKEINWKVHLETQDSIQYKLYMLLSSRDTTRTLDSLTVMTGRKVFIEYAN